MYYIGKINTGVPPGLGGTSDWGEVGLLDKPLPLLRPLSHSFLFLSPYIIHLFSCFISIYSDIT